MNTQVLPIIAPRKGLNFSIPADIISEMEISQCQNIRFEGGLIKKIPGFATLGYNLPLNNTVIGLYQLNLFTGTDYFLAVTTKAVYYLADPTGTPYWETIMANEVMEACEDYSDWEWDGDDIYAASESTIKKVGSYSVSFQTLSSFSTGIIGFRDNAWGDKSAYKFIRLWIRSSVATSAGDLTFTIYETAGGSGTPSNDTETLDIPALEANTWKLVFLEVSTPSTSLDSVLAISIDRATDLGSQKVYVDDIRLVDSFDSGATYDTSNSDLMSADVVRDTAESEVWWLMTNQVDAIQKWTGAPATALTDLGGTPPVCERLVGFKDYLLLLDVTISGASYKTRLQWPDTADFEDWSAGNSGSHELTGTDFIMHGVRFKGDYVVIAKKKSVWLGYSTNDSDIFQFDRRVSGIGTVAPHTLCCLGDIVVFLGEDDVYSFDGIDCISIGEGIRDELVVMQNPKQIAKSFGYVVMDKNEYHLVIPSSSSDYCDREYVWNYKLNAWSKNSLAYNLTCSAAWQKQTTKTIGDLVGTIGEQTWRMGERWNLEATPTTVFGDLNGYVYEVDNTLRNANGNAIDAWFSTKDFNPTGLAKRWRMLRLDVYFTGDGLDVEYSKDKGTSWSRIVSFGESTGLETPNSCYLKADLLMCRLRFRNAEAGETFEFSRANLYWQEAGVRL